MNCRYDRDSDRYILPDGEVCERDEYGDRTRHCTARRTCSQHIGFDELCCARCIGRTRTDIRQIVERAALMLPEAMEAGVNSEAANMAGPAGDYRVFSARRLIAKRWIEDHIQQPTRDWCSDLDCTRRHFKAGGGDRWHKRGLDSALADLLEDDDEWHPYSVLTRWAMMLAEDYDLKMPGRWDIANAADLLDRVLHRVAHDEGQDFPLFAREMRKCRTHLESVMRDSQQPEKGAPCPTCKGRGRFVRLTRWYPHWCQDPDCEQFHFDTEVADRMVCPVDKSHSWDMDSYRNYVEERVGA